MTLDDLLRNRQRLFWILNIAGWTGHTLAAWLGALAHEKPDSYFAVIAATALTGEIFKGTFWAQQNDSQAAAEDNRAFGAALEIPSDKLSAKISAQEIQENFSPALGFVDRSGIRRYDTEFRYRTRPETGRWRAINHRLIYSLVTDMNGATLSERTAIRPVSLYSHRDDFLFVEWERNEETVLDTFDLFDRLNVPAGRYEFDRYRAEITTGMQRSLRAVLSVQDGGFFGGDRLEKFVELQWRQSAHFFVSLSFTENDVVLPSGSFTSHLASLRTDIALNSRWSWSNLLQYDNTAEAVAINSRLRYLPEAGRELVFVLNHGATVDLDNRLHSTQNELNLKLSYTFRY